RSPWSARPVAAGWWGQGFPLWATAAVQPDRAAGGAAAVLRRQWAERARPVGSGEPASGWLLTRVAVRPVPAGAPSASRDVGGGGGRRGRGRGGGHGGARGGRGGGHGRTRRGRRGGHGRKRHRRGGYGRRRLGSRITG